MKFKSRHYLSVINTFLLSTLLLAGCSSPYKYEQRNSVKTTGSEARSNVTTTSSCRSPYIVKSGDTLSEIAVRCDVDMLELARVNDLLPPYIIYIKQELDLPAVEDYPVVSRTHDSSPEKRQQVKPAHSEDLVTSSAENKTTIAPVKSIVEKSSPTKKHTTTSAKAVSTINDKEPRILRDSKWQWPMHKGLDYRFKRDKAGLSVLEIYGIPGQKIKAVAPGKVVYAGNGIANYGWMLVVKHAKDYMSIYAHNSALLVEEGDYVETGQEIATLGATGTTTRPKLYLEARYQGRKIDIKKKLKP